MPADHTRNTRKHEVSEAAGLTPAAIRALPLDHFAVQAEAINDSEPLRAIFATPQFDELHEHGKLWVCGLVREAFARQAEAQPDRLRGDMIVQVNVFLTYMAERFREQTRRREGSRCVYRLTRLQAMQHALATYDSTLDLIGVPFGHPGHEWDRATAHQFVDDELQHWEG